jgi:hypothetical protein
MHYIGFSIVTLLRLKRTETSIGDIMASVRIPKNVSGGLKA